MHTVRQGFLSCVQCKRWCFPIIKQQLSLSVQKAKFTCTAANGLQGQSLRITALHSVTRLKLDIPACFLKGKKYLAATTAVKVWMLTTSKFCEMRAGHTDVL